ncbi:hypothetical protein [Thermotoga sp.]|uniref:hypothetical protein n=1 Tax=Thermotoga sp. TaxID=28240 RepID=UPI0025EC7F33|nr:hypothetical protein [Thermotoga sp.]MCD6551459.1 ammonium transporter [Thermotoga sp.]
MVFGYGLASRFCCAVLLLYASRLRHGGIWFHLHGEHGKVIMENFMDFSIDSVIFLMFGYWMMFGKHPLTFDPSIKEASSISRIPSSSTLLVDGAP